MAGTTESLSPTRSGASTVCMGGAAIHSRYDPAAEAEKYLRSLELGGAFRFFILVEPGLGYLIPPLRKNFPRTRIIALHCSPFYASPEARRASVSGIDGLSEWMPGGEDLFEFLEREIPDAGAAEIKVIEWRPSFSAYGEKCLDLLNRTVTFIKRMDANKRTVRGFGRRWLRNGLRNLEIITHAVSVKAGDSPVVVCASGPSLEESIPLILKWKALPSPPLILAVSSGLPALRYGGISPDLAIATDGGAWAALHLFEWVRSFGPQTPVIAAGFSAALPSQTEQGPVLLLCDGSLWQQFLLRKMGVPFLVFPMRGTVSAAALDLAFHISGGNVYIAGLDLAHRDLRTHARPHGFDRILEERAGRFTPLYSQRFVRARDINKSGAYEVYASWFRGQLERYPKRLYSFKAGAVPGIPVISPDHVPPQGDPPVVTGARCLNPGTSGPQGAGAKPGTRGRGLGVRLLCHALADPLFGRQLERELGELLFPDREGNIGAGELCKELMDLSS